MADVKVPALLHKMSVSSQKAWYKKHGMELPGHLSGAEGKSAAQAKKDVGEINKAKAKRLEIIAAAAKKIVKPSSERVRSMRQNADTWGGGLGGGLDRNRDIVSHIRSGGYIKAGRLGEEVEQIDEQGAHVKYDQGYNDAKNSKRSIHKTLTGNDRYNYLSGYEDGLTDRKKNIKKQEPSNNVKESCDQDYEVEHFNEGKHQATIAAIAAHAYVPKVGDKIRTRHGGQIPGEVTKVTDTHVHFKHAEGKTYKTSISNVMREEVEQIDESKSEDLRDQAVRSKNPAVIAAALKHKDPEVRGYVIHNNDHATSKHVAMVIRDKDPEVRIGAVVHKNATKEQVAMGIRDKHPEVRAAAATHSKASTEDLMYLARNDKDEDVRTEAKSALKHRGVWKAISSVQEALKRTVKFEKGGLTPYHYHVYDGGVKIKVKEPAPDLKTADKHMRYMFPDNAFRKLPFRKTPNLKVAKEEVEQVDEGAVRDAKVAKHNAAVDKMTKKGFAKLNYRHPDLLKTAPKGYTFNISHRLIPWTKEEVEQVDETNGEYNKYGHIKPGSVDVDPTSADKPPVYKTNKKPAQYKPQKEEADAVKMARGIAFDKRYKGGNMTGALNAIRKVGTKLKYKNLENHPKVKSALKAANEETEMKYIEEKLTAADPASKWISDFVKSDNPKFAGKSKKERIQMALGAKYASMRKEEVEQIDELKKSTLASYIKKSAEDLEVSRWTKNWGKLSRRTKGFNRAVNKLAKEEVEQIDELKASTLGSYMSKASKDEVARKEQGKEVQAKFKEAGMKVGVPYDRKLHSKTASRAAGKAMALKKLTGAAKVAANEEVEQTDEEIKQRKASVAGDGISRLAFRAGTADEVKKNHLKIYKKLKSTDPEKAAKFKKANKVEESAEGKTPETSTEVELAKKHGDPKKITYGDVIKARIQAAKKKAVNKGE